MDRKVIIGFKTIILGLCLYVIELLFLPVFGTLQKAQVSGDGFYSDFWKYAGGAALSYHLYADWDNRCTGNCFHGFRL